MNIHKLKTTKRIRRHRAIRSTLAGTAARPRLSVFRSNKNIYAQIIDDERAHTICSSSDIKIATGTKSEKAAHVGKTIAAAAHAAGITTVVFDRGGFRYIGRVAALAEAARLAGLTF